MKSLRNLLAVCLVLCITLGMAATAFAWNSITEAVELGIEKADTMVQGTVEVELGYRQSITADDWTLLQNNKKPFQLTYRNISYRFPHNGSELGYNSLCLDTVDIPEALVDAVCEATGLSEDEFMLVLPARIGTLPATATIGVALSSDFVEQNGNQNVNIYGIDFAQRTEAIALGETETAADYAHLNGEVVTRTNEAGEEESVYEYDTYFVRAIGLAATRSGEKSYSAWLNFQSGTSRMMLLTTRSIEQKGTMSWGSSSNGMAETDRVLTGEEKVQTATGSNTVINDSNPNTGAQPVHGLLLCGIVLLGSASVFTLVRTLRKRG